MLARLLVEMARFSEDTDEIQVEVDGYEVVVQAAEIDEFEGVLRIKCSSVDGPDEDDDDEDFDSDDDIPWCDGPSCDMPERPLESLDISEMEPREG